MFARRIPATCVFLPLCCHNCSIGRNTSCCRQRYCMGLPYSYMLKHRLSTASVSYSHRLYIEQRYVSGTSLRVLANSVRSLAAYSLLDLASVLHTLLRGLLSLSLSDSGRLHCLAKQACEWNSVNLQRLALTSRLAHKPWTVRLTRGD
jgi:hypothetical protein